MPDVANTPRGKTRNLAPEQVWTYHGALVVEVDNLSESGEDSQRSALDRKMRYNFFRPGIQLGWLIDPRPGYERMYEYLDEHGQLQCSANNTWRDLNGRDVLHGFTQSIL
ncbi:LOW QUALITY PROTEIN: hypothetical protein PHMEG_00030520 [Phytophthora megakarya]|uniref:Restriction endonuclease domain-containing protein n=1 Tax=Phytophthora megakarya TaxID=4795 RepID=A0A225V045_9STRA|nr:LOW QUALITY PROTEIN: hypothetical protein PHMEG_00030520 [Phytophthora megakarya]